jgi:hypothetical protein
MSIVKKLDEAGNLAGFWDEEANQWVPDPDKPVEELEEPALPEDNQGGAPVDFSSWTKDQLKSYLDERGLPYDKNANKDTLVTLVDAADATEKAI